MSDNNQQSDQAADLKKLMAEDWRKSEALKAKKKAAEKAEALAQAKEDQLNGIKPKNTSGKQQNIHYDEEEEYIPGKPFIPGELVGLSANARMTGKELFIEIDNIVGRFGLSEDMAQSFKQKVDVDALRRIVDNIFVSQKDSKYCFLNAEGSLVMFNPSKAWKQIVKTFGTPLSAARIREAIKQQREHKIILLDEDAEKDLVVELANMVSPVILDRIALFQQRGTLGWEVDMFASRPRLEFIEGQARIILNHKPWEGGEFSQAVVDDFKEHWPQAEDFLDFVVNARFASDRKKAYLWWQASSDFGKGLVASVLADIGILVSMTVKQIEQIYTGTPVGMSADDFRRAFILHVDEWNSVRPELKMLQNNIYLSPKHQLQQSVAIYTKFFTGADDVQSLVTSEGVEDQFANRLSLITSTGTIEDRELFQKIGKAAYALNLRNWFCRRINEGVLTMQEMGSAKATKAGDIGVVAFHDMHGIGQQRGVVSDHIADVAEDFRNAMLKPREKHEARRAELDLMITEEKDTLASRDTEWKKLVSEGKKDEAEILMKKPVFSQTIMRKRSRLENEIAKFDDHTVEGHGDKIILPKPRSRFEEWVKKEFAYSEQHTIRQRARSIIEAASTDGRGAKPHKAKDDNKVIKGILLRGGEG